MNRIFSSILTPGLVSFDEEIKGMGSALTAATVELYGKVCEQFLPTPAKCHYLFNMRDVGKVIAGILSADHKFVDTRESMLRLWAHESCRVFADRFISPVDVDTFRSIVDDVFKSKLDGASWDSSMSELENPVQGPVFCDFLEDGAPYSEAKDLNTLKIFLEEKLEDYNLEPGYLPMELVLFRDALRHICRVARIVRHPRGNCMFIGVGGSGRRSLTRLAAYASEMALFTIEITKQYRQIEFHEDLKRLYTQAGCDNKPTVFLFSDTQLKEESFLEDINNILSSGEVPNLFPKDEMAAVYDAVRGDAKKAGVTETAEKLWQFFIERVRQNLHIVLAMSPVGEGFRTRCRMYPALVSNTTMNYFHPWPEDALVEVASRFLEDVKLGGNEDADGLKVKVGKVFALAHQSVAEASTKCYRS